MVAFQTFEGQNLNANYALTSNMATHLKTIETIFGAGTTGNKSIYKAMLYVMYTSARPTPCTEVKMTPSASTQSTLDFKPLLTETQKLAITVSMANFIVLHMIGDYFVRFKKLMKTLRARVHCS